MHRRGLQEGDAHRREIEANEELDRVESGRNAKIQSRDNWFLKILRCAVVFVPAALLTVVIAERIFKLPNPVIYLLTLASLKAAFGVSVLTSLIGSRWLKFKRLLIAGVIFSIGLFGFVVWLTRSH
jgi:hypothetical protein